MLNKPLDQITKEDIEALVADQVAEGKHIEYKEQIPGTSDGDKKEFLADISSLANAGGGHLLFGIKEKRNNENQATGIPESVEGLEGVNPDNEISRLESMILAGIEPRTLGFHSLPMNGFPKGPIIIIYIPKSWIGPHMVTYKNTSRFYSRTSNGKYQLDVDEIRSSFLRSEGVYKKISRFRNERLDLMLRGENPVTDESKPAVVLHLVPLGFEDPSMAVDVAAKENVLRQIQPLYSSASTYRFNFYGYMISSLDASGRMIAYSQFYRSGINETVSGRLIRIFEGAKSIPNVAFVQNIVSVLRNLITVYRQLEIEGPFLLFLTLLRVKGYFLYISPYDDSTPIEKENLFFSEIVIENFDEPPEKILRPLFDMVWQSCGYPKCHHYDDNGNWLNPR